MKRVINLVACAIAVFVALLISACSSDGPDMPNVDYGKLRIGKMNLSGAAQLALMTGSHSRAIEGEYLSAGLYKVDKDGKISAVGIYFTTDTLGNRLEKEYALRVAPRKLFQLTSNYMLATNCEYYDVDGDIVRDKWIEVGDDDEDIRLIKQEVPYKNLLVRLTDGKVWCVDNIITTIAKGSLYNVESVKGIFKESPDGVLYQKIDYDVYKYNLTNDNPSFEQVIVFPDNVSYVYPNLHIVSNGVLWNYTNGTTTDLFGRFSEIEFAWPHSGFQIMNVDDIETEAYDNPIVDLAENPEELKYRPVLDRNTRCAFFCIQNKPYVLLWTPGWCYSIGKDYYGPYSGSDYYDVAQQRYWKDVARFYEISVGDNPGSARLKTDYAMLTDIPESARSEKEDEFGYNIYSICANDEFIITSGTNNWLTLLDVKKQEWRWLKQLDFYLNLASGDKYYDKIFVLNSDRSKFGVYWFDVNTLEDGFTPFNVQLPDYISIYPSDKNWNDGVITFSGRNPATGDIEYIYIDITTGEATHKTSKIEMIFETLISLS